MVLMKPWSGWSLIGSEILNQLFAPSCEAHKEIPPKYNVFPSVGSPTSIEAQGALSGILDAPNENAEEGCVVVMMVVVEATYRVEGSVAEITPAPVSPP